jgi:hypothetical protein
MKPLAAAILLLSTAQAVSATFVLRIFQLEVEIRRASINTLLEEPPIRTAVHEEKHVHVTPSSPYFPWYIAAIIILVLLVCFDLHEVFS